jgi:hypothetical protein
MNQMVDGEKLFKYSYVSSKLHSCINISSIQCRNYAVKTKFWKMKFLFCSTEIYRRRGTEKGIMLVLLDKCDEKY